ncbi:hypothetical protein Tco_0220350, partial [Tanacetum coccineum]
MGTVRFGNDQFSPILGYGDLIQGNVTIKRVYYVEGLNHTLFSVGQFCDADLEVAFRKSTCFVRDLQGNDLLTGSRGSDLYTISLQETTSSVQASVVNVKWCLLKITLQAPFLNVQMTFDHSRSSLGLHGNDAPFLNVQKTFDHHRSSLGLHGNDV